jgi:hypothetical protein
MTNVARDRRHISWCKLEGAVAKFDPQSSLQHEKRLVRIRMDVSGERLRHPVAARHPDGHCAQHLLAEHLRRSGMHTLASTSGIVMVVIGTALRGRFMALTGLLPS